MRPLLWFPLVPAVLAWTQPCELPPLKGGRELPGHGEVRFCAPEKLPIRQATAAVLVDDSGSMAGYRSVMDRFGLWVGQGLSQVRNHGMSFSKTRGCFFSSARPLAACQESQLKSSGFQGRRDTTLNQAIEYAAQFDLAVILTDGAGATGGSGQGECADGVDAACVARALSAAMRPRAGEPRSRLAGLWILPLVALYDGPLYTEQPVPTENFDAEQAVNAVSRETDLATEVKGAKSGARGLLEYQYTGPRAFFVFVIARPAELGRAFLGSLMARREFSQVAAIESLRQFRGGLAASRPIEVFPGIAPNVEWASSRLGEKMCRTVDARYEAGQVTINCPNAVDRATLHLRSRIVPPGSECAVIQSLPAASLRLIPGALGPVINEYRWAGGGSDSPLELSLLIHCRKTWRLACNDNNAVARWELRRDYSASASRMASEKPVTRAEQAVFALSASEVTYQPHRVFQLRETLEKFYRDVTSVAQLTDELAASIRICKP